MVLGAHTEQGLRSQHAYIAAISTAQEAERGRLARELHDEIVQQLIALGHSLDRVQRLLKRDVAQATERLQTMRTSITGGRRATHDHWRSASALDELGLLPAVELLLQRTRQAGPEVTLLVQGDEQRLAPQSELALFRIVQEAWSNIRRHAQARQADFTFTYTPDGLVVTISDDGIGFTPPMDSVGCRWNRMRSAQSTRVSSMLLLARLPRSVHSPADAVYDTPVMLLRCYSLS